MTQLPQDIATTLKNGLEAAQRIPVSGHALMDARLGGFVELAAVDAADRIWVMGWLQGDMPVSCGLLILDGAPTPAGMVMTHFARTDLPPGAIGFLGLIEADWRPQGGQPLAAILTGPGGRHLRAPANGLTVLEMAAFATVAEATQAHFSAPWAGALRALVFAPETILPGLHPKAAPRIEVAIDTVVAITGVGVMVEGWALARERQVTGFALRIGATTIRPDLRCSWRMARPDLIQALPQAAGLADEAGFVMFFPVADADLLRRPMLLEIQQARGVTTRHPLPEDRMEWLHRGAGEASLLRCYPAIECEPFFPSMARVIKLAGLAPRQRPVAWKAESHARILAVAVAHDPHEPWRVMDACSDWRNLARAHDAGLVILAPEQIRSRILPLFRDFDAIWPGQASLLFTAGTQCHPADLVLAMDTLKAEDFVLLRDGCHASPEALELCLAHLAKASPADPPAALLLGDGPRSPGNRLQAGAIVWNRAGLARHVHAGSAWDDIARRATPLGTARRSVMPAQMRPMLQKLTQAGVRL